MYTNVRKHSVSKHIYAFVLPLLGLLTTNIIAAETSLTGDANLAQELTNPLANMMTIPIQMNFDNDIGSTDKGNKITTNIQPIIPFDLNDDWYLVTRTIVPVISQQDIFPGADSQFGLGDINMSLFFSPKKPNSKGFMWGMGPVFLLPTATDAKLGGKKWGAGPSAVVLSMQGSWTFGVLGNHIWSFAGNKDRSDISNTFVQPFVSHTWPSAWTVSLQSESSYNWKAEQWSIPINLGVSKLVKFGKLPVNLQAGVGYWLESPDTGPEGVRFRLQANFVLPR